MTLSNEPARPLVGQIRTDDEHGDLLHFHTKRIREQQATVEIAKGPVDSARASLKVQKTELTKRFNEAKNDLGGAYDRDYLEDLLAGGDVPMRKQVTSETMRARDKRLLGQAVFGQQPDLFPGEETPTFTRDEQVWQAEGYLRGLRGDMDEIKEGDPPEFMQAIMRGFEKGQADTSERVARAMEAKAKAGMPDPEQQPVDLNEPEPGTPEAKAKERKAVDRVRASLGAPANKVPA